MSPGSGRGSQVTRWPLAWNERVPTQSGGGVGVWSEPRRQERHPEWWRQGRFVLIRPDTQASVCLVTQWSFKKHLSERQGGRKSCPRLVHPPKAHRSRGGASRSPEPGAPPRSPTWGGGGPSPCTNAAPPRVCIGRKLVSEPGWGEAQAPPYGTQASYWGLNHQAKPPPLLAVFRFIFVRVALE